MNVRFHHSHSSDHHGHFLRIILLILIAFIAYLAWTETAGAEVRSVVVLSADFEMRHYTTAGSVEAKPRESASACQALHEGVCAAAESHPALEVVSLPALTVDEQAKVDEHVALLGTIVANIRYMANTPGLKLTEDFGPQSVALQRYCIGNGLKFLRERTGADLGLIVHGWHVAPTGGRRAIGVLLYGAIPPEGGGLSVAMADLETGELVWFQSIGDLHVTLFGKGGQVDDEVVTDPVRAEAMFDELMSSYRGGAG